METGENKRSEEVIPGDGMVPLETSIYRVVGGTEEKQDDVLAFHHDQMHSDTEKDFEYGGEVFKMEDFEREKTEEETAMVTAVLEKMQEFMREMGDENPLRIRPEQVHFLDSKKARESGLPTINFFEMKGQFIGIYDLGSNLRNAQGLVHELMHFNSFQSLEIGKNGSFKPRRFGISTKVKGEDKFYFDELNEAVATELTKTFDREYFSSIPGLQNDLRIRQNVIDWQKKQPNGEELANEIAFVEIDTDAGVAKNMSYSYEKQRRYLDEVAADIFRINQERNLGLVESEKDAYMLFVQAVMTGNMLDLAHVIEKTYGAETLGSEEGSFKENKKKLGTGFFRALGRSTKGPK